MQDYYKILNVSNNSSDDEIKKSYLKLIKKYHPDVYTGDKVFAEKQTALITEAYTTLKNKELKMKYDQKIFGQNINAKESQTTNNSQTKTKKQSNPHTSAKSPKENEQTKTQQEHKNPQQKGKQENAKITDDQKQSKNQKIILDLAIISLLLLLFLLLFFPLK